MPTGASVAYVAGTTHRPIPIDTSGYRGHAPAQPKRTGLNWDDLRPKCRTCQRPSGELNGDDLCPGCIPTPVVATSTPATTGPFPEPVAAALGGRRPAAGAGGEAPRQPAKAAKRVTNPRPTQSGVFDGRSSSVDRDKIVRLYTSGQTMGEIREATGNALGTIRRVLVERNVQLRDDRKTRSGGKRIEAYPEDLVAGVRRCYIDEQLTIAATAVHLGTTSKIVAGVMRVHNIPARPDASKGGLPGVDRSVGLKQRIADLGVTARDIKEWGLRAGLIYELAVGLPSARLVDAYADAHTDQQEAS